MLKHVVCLVHTDLGGQVVYCGSMCIFYMCTYYLDIWVIAFMVGTTNYLITLFKKLFK